MGLSFPRIFFVTRLAEGKKHRQNGWGSRPPHLGLANPKPCPFKLVFATSNGPRTVRSSKLPRAKIAAALALHGFVLVIDCQPFGIDYPDAHCS